MIAEINGFILFCQFWNIFKNANVMIAEINGLILFCQFWNIFKNALDCVHCWWSNDAYPVTSIQ